MAIAALDGRTRLRLIQGEATPEDQGNMERASMTRNPQLLSDEAHRPATREDFRRILGELDEPRVIDVLELHPTVADLEEAAICLAGDQDVLGKEGHRVSLLANQVVEILSADEGEELQQR
jgi:hypothetical protein